SLLNERTRLVGVAHVSNALGTVNPVTEITRLAHDAGALVLVDGAQAVAHQAVDVQAIGCDFYAFSGHKLYGPTGIGVLYARFDILNAMPPWQGGGDMIHTVSFERSTYADVPQRFEAGTPNIAGVVALDAAIQYVQALGLDAIAAHESALLETATRELTALPGLRLVGTAPEKAGIASFVIDGIHPHDLGTILDMEGVAIRAGHHCAMPLMTRFGLPGTARASFAVYNTEDDIAVLLAALRKAQKLFGFA
ncbi:MAG: cysteine desulfurase, partial [Burkholderiaceae bacterium]